MYVCMYVCVCVYMNVCMYVCVCVCITDFDFQHDKWVSVPLKVQSEGMLLASAINAKQ